MKTRYLLTLVTFLVAHPSLGFTEPPETKDLPSADEVIERALARSEQKRETNVEGLYTFYSSSRNVKLDKDGEPKEVETRRFHNIPYRGHSYARLIEIDGQPLAPEERRKEEEREREFREKVDKGEPPDVPDEERMAFDEELVSRYDFAMEGLEKLDGRWTYVVAFTPKEGDLPVRRRIDRALNKSSGKVWFDRETYSIAQVSFELMEKIKLWWGLIGSISQMRGNLKFQPLEEDDLWMPSHFEFYINGRILFKSLHQTETVNWSGFEKADGDSEQTS
jgi:hypothetical protein